MDFVTEKVDDIAIINVNLERATLKEADSFKKLLLDTIDDGCRKLIINISECEFIDSTFLGVLVSGLKKTVRQSGDLKLIGFKPAVRSMFELTRMYRVFDSYTTVEDAINSFNE